jgi:murein DD-endopeptidase MepM/ murein hydrolase activator NlpD
MKVINSENLRSWINENEEDCDQPPVPNDDFKLWWTVEGYKVVTQWFGVNPQWYPQTNGHEGIDLRAPNGTKILAGQKGEVYRVEPDPNSGPYGIQVRLVHDHPDGPFKTIYAHFMEALVKVGDVVDAGQPIGLANNTGNSSGAHLHLTLKKVGDGSDWMNFGDIVNPVPYMPDLFPNGEWRLDIGGNFRTEPRVASNTLIRYLGSNNIVTCTGEIDGDWWRIVFNSVIGWFWNPGYKMFPR